MSTFEQRVEQHHVVSFQAATAMAYQQSQSRLRPFVTEQACEGEANVAVHIFGQVEGQKLAGRKPENVDNPALRTRRWLVYDDPFVQGEVLPQVDMWRQAFDPRSDLLAVHTAAVRRYIDDQIIQGVIGTAYEGKRASTPMEVPAGQVIGTGVGGAGSGLNIDKLIAIRNLYGRNEVDLDGVMRPVLAVTQQQMTNLLSVDKVQNNDFMGHNGEVLRTGMLKNFYGIDLVIINRLPLKAGTSNVRICPSWMPDNVVLGVWQDVKANIWNDTSKRNIPTMEVSALVNATRKQEKGVVLVECTES